MRLCSFRRAARLVLAALVASVAPGALLPAGAQDRVVLRFAGTPPVLDRTRAPETGPETGVAATRNLTIREFEDGPTPLEAGFYKLPGLSAGDILPERAILAYIGQDTGLPEDATGTGNQLYYLGAEIGVTERLQLGFSRIKFADPVTFGGSSNDIFMRSISANAAFRFHDSGRLQVTARASAEWFSYRSDFHSVTGTETVDSVIGSLHLPVALSVGHGGQLLFVPGVSVLPDQINGADMFGVLPSVGVGATLHASQRLGFYGMVNVPVAGRGNTYDKATGAVISVPVWTAGARFMATPKAALDLYVTNGFGASPATEILAFPNGGREPVLGVKLSYTPGWSRSYRPNYRGFRDAPLTLRDRHLQYRGLTLASSETLEAGTILLTAGGGTAGHKVGSVRFSPDHDLEFGYFVEDLAFDGSRAFDRLLTLVDPGGIIRGDEIRWGVQGKIRLLDQVNGSPFSMAANLEVGREFSIRTGAAYVSAPSSYRFSSGLAITAEPKAGFFASQRLYGLGLGVNAELFRGLDLLAEVTPMANGEPAIWAAGARFHLDALGWLPASIDVSASNSVGSRAVGGMLAQDEIRYSVGVTVPLNGKRLFDSLF